VANDLIETRPNVSALAREHGVSRATIRRRLVNGWTPPVTIEGEISNKIKVGRFSMEDSQTSPANV